MISEDIRRAHIEETKRLVIAVLRRENICGYHLCPVMGGSDEPNKKVLRKLAKVEADIRQSIGHLEAMEKDAGGTIGVAAVISDAERVTPEIRIGLALLVAGALTSGPVRCRTVSDLAQTACCRDAGALITFHEAWRNGSGVLRKLCSVDLHGAWTLGDMSRPAIRESPLRRYLGLPDPDDDEFVQIEAVRAMLGVR